MRGRHWAASATLIGLLAGFGLPALADPGVVPTRDDVKRNVRDLRVTPPSVGVPEVNPDNPQLPNLPYVEIPAGLNPALGVASPAGVVTCQVAYLAPLGGAVAMTAVLDQLPPGSLPVQPSFLAPLFGPVTTACVLAPFPRWTACENDAAVHEQSDAVPGPFASLVVEVDAIQQLVSHYALNRQPMGRDVAGNLAKRLGCT